MKWTAAGILVLTAAVLLFAAADLPPWGDPHSPAAEHLSPKYITDSYEDTKTPNMVTAVIADYRGYDTLFETAVIFTAGLACVLILAEVRRRESQVR